MALLLAASGSVSAGECVPQIRDAWVRMPPMPMPMMAGFAHIENPCKKDVVVVGATSAAFGEVDMHETTVVEGVSRMRPVPELRIAAGKSAVLKPGSLHLMLMQPVANVSANDKIAIDFKLSNGRTIRGDFVVRKAGE
ncbi:copper chaperone PCu(A)C [Lysobacter arvi]|uniref:Copper chaperone PCu(A)C n=1 Tax=Lysobacter arvi TaxID=3038776 RepID=A0ABU1CBQ2_9GAMM|nr:copper chaperone PCu(A)C [Lysobacter arvi]MDR0182592.1 copper chaperone PCu(A)C [Lysobacter arvi]